MLSQLGASAFADLWAEFLAVFQTLIAGIASGFKGGFMEILYQDPTAQTLVVSDLAKFGFGVAAVGVASALSIGLVKRFVRGRVR